MAQNLLLLIGTLVWNDTVVLRIIEGRWMDFLFRKINDSSGVDGLAHKQYLKMQVWSGTSSGVATQGNGLSGLDLSSFVQQACLQVSINRLKTVQMTDYHKPAITAIVVSCLAYITFKGRSDRVTDLQGKVYEAASPSPTSSRIRPAT